ncbi:hypothetical protein UFOVP181_425 [uncultured Caudovirales phage]|uniref:Uncharacterized protein n=1 Tax=uncultured Caudovirales phage TaxID=2100421 RepID=A0A6J7WF71_9CAUD|nr:hypothetical protein UFOVP57_214 [uncultured Caudovirales phage]CAB5209328.1 hypothetical protein UFOVP181_425 [uncultured Caudovirales phage]
MTQVNRSIRLQANQSSALNRATSEPGEIFYDTTNKTLRIYDGRTSSGSILATQTWVNANTINSTELTSALGPYATTASLSSYVTQSSLTTQLNSYATTASLSSYATTASLSTYATTVSVTTAINNIPAPTFPFSYTVERSGVGSVGQVLSYGNGSSTSKGLFMPYAGHLYEAIFSATNITGTFTMDLYVNGAIIPGYTLTATGTTENKYHHVKYATPFAFAQYDQIGWYISAVGSAANAYEVNYFVTYN